MSIVLGREEPHLWPALLKSRPPSPRTASEMRNVRPETDCCPEKKPVGWNWTNSRLDILAEALAAMAMPSPVLTPGLVVIG